MAKEQTAESPLLQLAFRADGEFNEGHADADRLSDFSRTESEGDWVAVL